MRNFSKISEKTFFNLTDFLNKSYNIEFRDQNPIRNLRD
jgi:hypothetical protein